ncbi:hypothetical protein EXS71_04395 [Candidatus Uhrbacteria bacterium]|nr:hypothetical protein [Candidatus Uhrbacteria bacterium]
MIRKNHRPLYREVVAEAMQIAWHERKWWVLALFAGILQTGGMYDAILVFTKRMADESYTIFSTASLSAIVSRLPVLDLSSFSAFFYSMMNFERLVFFGLITLAILVCSLIAQGALIAGVGERVRGKSRSLSSALSLGAHHVWRIAGLNVITLGLLWFARFLVLVPVLLSWQNLNLPHILMYLVAFIVFLMASIFLTTMHLFALNEIVLHDLSLEQALESALHLWRRSWVIILETGAVLLAVGAAILLFTGLLFAISSLPLLVLMLSASLLHQVTLFWIAYALGWFFFTGLLLLAGMFTITFYYATWNKLHGRIHEGRVVAKFHRIIHWIHSLHPS